MDPYAVITCGGQRFRTKTHTDGGRHPVWNQSFQFNVINENTVGVELYDSDTFSRDDKIGSCTVDLSRARMSGSDSQQAAVRTSKGKQHGFVSVRIAFKPNQPVQAAAPAHPAPAAVLPYGAPPPYGYAPAPSFAPYGPPPPAFAPQPSYHYQPSFQQPPAPYGQPPAPYGQPSYPPAPGAAAPPPAPPPPVTPSPSGYYPSVPTTQQFYPGPAQAQGGPPPPLRLY